jgi:hypothetical protein
MSQESVFPPKLNNDGLDANAKDVISPLPSSLTIIAPSSFVEQILKLWPSDIKPKFIDKVKITNVIKKFIDFNSFKFFIKNL